MDTFLKVIDGGFMQTVVLAPLMSAVFATIFASFTRAPSSQAPKTITRTRTEYVTIIKNSKGGSAPDDDAGPLLGLLMVGLAMLIINYAKYVDDYHYWMAVTLVTFLSFGICALIISIINGQITSHEWWVYLMIPLGTLVFCAFLLVHARNSFDPIFTTLLNQQGALVNILFGRGLSDYGQTYLIFHVFGFVLLCITAMFASLTLIHYISLMNQRSDGWTQGFWFVMADISFAFGRTKWIILMLILLILSFLMIEPRGIAMWLS